MLFAVLLRTSIIFQVEESTVNVIGMNDFPVIGDPCFEHRILGSPGGKHCESLQRNVWRGVVSLLKAVSLDRECRILP